MPPQYAPAPCKCWLEQPFRAFSLEVIARVVFARWGRGTCPGDLDTEFPGMALNCLFCADVLRSLDLVSPPHRLYLQIPPGHRTCQCGSSCFIHVPSLKFIGLPVPKISLIFGHSIYPSGEPLTFDLLTLEVVCNVNSGTDNVPANSGSCETFLCRVTGKHMTTWRFITLSFDL